MAAGLFCASREIIYGVANTDNMDMIGKKKWINLCEDILSLNNETFKDLLDSFEFSPDTTYEELFEELEKEMINGEIITNTDDIISCIKSDINETINECYEILECVKEIERLGYILKTDKTNRAEG